MSYSIKNVLIGSDPEIFIKDKSGELSSAINLFKGTKDNPIDIGKGCFVQEDNILVEFNTPPTNNLEVFLKSVDHSKNYIETILAPLDKELYYSSSEIATKKILEDEKANIFGCSPSYNVLDEQSVELNIELLSEEDRNLRSAGMHIHIGYEYPEEETNDRLVLCFELFVTLPLINQDLDVHNRRLLYGKIGDSRDKDYGVECRSLGGYFLRNEESITDVWNRTLKAIEFANNSKKTNKELKELVESCLNSDKTVNLKNLDKVLNNLNDKQLA